MTTRHFFKLGIRFAEVKASNSPKINDNQRKLAFNDFVSLCKAMKIPEPDSYNHLISQSSYSQYLSQPLLSFKIDLYNAGIRSYSILLLNITAVKMNERELRKLNIKVNDSELKMINDAIEEDQNYILNIFKKWKIPQDPIKLYLKESDNNPFTAFTNLRTNLYPVLDNYIDEDDLPKNWIQKIDRAFGLKLSAFGLDASIDLNYILNKWFKK